MTKTSGMFACRTSLCLTLAVSLVITASSDASGKDESPKDAGQKATESERLVDALVNRNPRPRIVKRVGHSDPIFDEGYDWKEQDRVVRAIQAVAKQASPEMWEALISHENDDRYCLTFANENGFTHNKSVGDFCGWIADDQLMFPVERNLERVNRERAANDLKHVFLGGIDESLKKWRAARSGKPFFELQIEVCQRALQELPDVKNVSADAKADCRKRLEAEIDTLRRTKAGIFGGFKFPGDRYDLFDKERAKVLRKQAAATGG